MHELVNELMTGMGCIGIEPGSHSICPPYRKTTLSGSKIELESATSGRLKLVSVDGHSVQTIIHGKNLFDGKFTNGWINVDNGNLEELNPNLPASAYSTNTIELNANESYTVSSVVNGKETLVDSTNSVRWRIWKKDGTFAHTLMGDSITRTHTPTFASKVRVLFPDGLTENQKSKIQIEHGRSATIYEPYIDGVHSPSSDYPQEIQSVGIRTKNLYDPSGISTSSHGVTYTVNPDKSITITGELEKNTSGENTYSTSILKDVTSELQSGKTYKFSPQENIMIQRTFTNGTKNFDTTFTFDPENTSKVEAYVYTSSTNPNDLGKLNKTVYPMLSEVVGADPAKYEPYGHKLDIYIEKKNNLFISNNLEQGTFAGQNGLPTIELKFQRVRTKDYIPLKNGVYTLSLFGADNVVCYKYSKQEQLISMSPPWENHPYTFQMPQDGYVKFAFRTKNNEQLAVSNVKNVMLTNTISDQEQSISIIVSEPLRSIGDIKDRFICRNGIYGINRITGNKKFNGNEAWSLNEVQEKTTSFRCKLENATQAANASALCTRAIIGKGDTQRFSVGYGHFYIQLNNPITQSEFIQLLQRWNLEGNPMETIYPLQIPIWEPFPETIQQQINSLTITKGTNHIYTTDPLQPVITVEYKKKGR